MKQTTTKTVKFQVRIPNLDGDGIAETVPIDVEVYHDPETGEEVLTQDSVSLIEKTQARHMGLMSPEEIKHLRWRLDVTQQEISELLQVGEKTYSRWENGRSRPSRSMNLLLCALRDGCISVNYLRFRRNPELKAEWFAKIFEPKDFPASSAEYTLNWNEDLRLELTRRFKKWRLKSCTALAIGLSASPKFRDMIFIADRVEKTKPIVSGRIGTQPSSEQGPPFTPSLGRQTRSPHSIPIEPEEEPCG